MSSIVVGSVWTGGSVRSSTRSNVSSVLSTPSATWAIVPESISGPPAGSYLNWNSPFSPPPMTFFDAVVGGKGPVLCQSEPVDVELARPLEIGYPHRGMNE